MPGFAAAEEVKGKITKIDEKGVTVLVKNSTDKDGKTYSYAKDCKFLPEGEGQGQGSDQRRPASQSYSKKLPTMGLSATITTNDKNEVTEVLVTAKKKAAN